MTTHDAGHKEEKQKDINHKARKGLHKVRKGHKECIVAIEWPITTLTAMVLGSECGVREIWRVKSSKKYYLINSEILENHQVSQNYLNGGAVAKPEMVRTIAKTVAHKGLCSGRKFWLWLAFGFAELAEMTRFEIMSPVLLGSGLLFFVSFAFGELAGLAR